MRTAALALALASLAAAPPAPVPHKVGQCVRTSITEIANRLEEAPGKPLAGSGSAVSFANGLNQVSYEQIPAVDRSHVGDPVRICLVFIPHPCPAGDDRGRIYRTTNLRSGRSWKMPDSEHSCGGA